MGAGGECEEGVGDEVKECRAGLVLAVWAVGGEVSVLTILAIYMWYCSVSGSSLPWYALAISNVTANH